jgi:uncharacterized protein (TIGR02246 family)
MNAWKMKWGRVLLAVCGLAAYRPDAASAEPTPAAAKPDTRWPTEIEQLLAQYERALNANDVQGVVQLYTDDGVLLPQGTPSVVGIKAIQKFYAGTFQAIDLDLKFHIAEVQVLSNEWAFVRTTSTGVIKILANATQVPASNQELFVVRKNAGHWRLARYSFSSTLPPAK